MMRLVAVVAALLIASHAVAAERPNVLIVMTDDQGLGDFSFMGNPVLKTPNLDAFAKQSVRLTDFHVCPMCSPTRGQLMTGLAALRNGATSVTAGRTFVRPGLPMMPAIFAKAGYRTGLFGKWHLGDSYPHRPIDRGFQESVYHLGWGMLQSTPDFDNPLFDGRYFHNGEPKKLKGHCTDFWFDSAMAWMKERKEKNEPFLCYLPTNAPHGPHIDREEFIKLYQGKGPAAFFGMIAHVDARFGDLMKFLDENKLSDNTIVIFMTDNGGTGGVNVFNAELRGRKTQYYEGGHRVPCWVRWPSGGLGKPRDIDVPTQNTDLLPTLCDFCGIAQPERPKADAIYTGTSLAALLPGEAKSLPERTLVVQYGQTPAMFDCCIIRGKWRLVAGKELYDVAADRAQEKDIAASNPEVVKSMREYYEAWWKGVEPLLDDFVPISIGAKQQPIVELTSGDWQNIYADNTGHVRSAVGGPTGGQWSILVEEPGEYEFTLRRWPEQTKAALGDKYDDPDAPKKKGVSKVFPSIAQARLEIAGISQTAKADAKSTGVTIAVKLPAGKTNMRAWFQDAAGKDLCGAFFVTVRRK